MAAPRKYPDELRERAIRLVLGARRDPVSRPAACRRIGDQLGINPETLRGWVNRAETDAGDRPGTTASDARRMAELEREVRELRRANAILKAASAFFASVPDWMVARRGWLVSSLPSWLVRDVPSRRVGAAGRGVA
ncbi:transposase IS3/IS911 family protein [Cellulomonas gilvus ATCC 13127]|uniref:Transposase IS3/IS911 family protein n=1 Tax=Cellulomonas gilvus (strain ATCC 13127 / NRRL B-14078) TaxID=593907 RepID=F8A4E8_CELGA|nr:transposase [Cellulomonas gilvus]AEI12054.1 transposase IS3/IS911 family protein [Cellulomonas gilvus ATCC 13127]